MTLLGQADGYWTGGYREVIEFNPAARLLLTLHPLVFVAAGCLSSLLVAAVITRATESIAFVCSFVVTFCHGVAAASWLLRTGSIVGIVGAVLLVLAAERLLTWTWHRHAALRAGSI